MKYGLKFKIWLMDLVKSRRSIELIPITTFVRNHYQIIDPQSGIRFWHFSLNFPLYTNVIQSEEKS